MSIIIAGAGQSGFQVAASLREAGFAEPITLVGEETSLPYQRPPLSKGYIAGTIDVRSLPLRPAGFFEENKINLLIGERAVRINRTDRRLQLASGSELTYEHLVIAAGTRNRLLTIPGADLDGVHYLRTVKESEFLRTRLRSGISVVVIGAGFIGLEFASVANELGARATIIEAQERPLSRAVCPEISGFYTRIHEFWGTRICTSTTAERVVGKSGRVTGVQTNDGRILPADIVLVATGVIANAELATSSDLPVNDGVVVNNHLLTPDPHVSAVGDCANHPNPYAAKQTRLESVQNAIDQARVVAARLVGHPTVYNAVPWFWSDQRKYKLQIAGITAGADRWIVRGQASDGAFSVFCFARSKFIGAESVNRPADHVIARRFLASGSSLCPDLLTDESIDLKSISAAITPNNNSPRRTMAAQ